jgi:hypothetical protein
MESCGSAIGSLARRALLIGYPPPCIVRDTHTFDGAAWASQQTETE